MAHTVASRSGYQAWTRPGWMILTCTSFKRRTQISPKVRCQHWEERRVPQTVQLCTLSLDLWLTKGQSGSNCFCCVVLKCQISDVFTGTAWLRLAWHNSETRRSLLFYLFARRTDFHFQFLQCNTDDTFPGHLQLHGSKRTNGIS